MRTLLTIASLFIVAAVSAMAASAPEDSANFTNVQTWGVSDCAPDTMRVCTINLTSTKTSGTTKSNSKYTVTAKVNVVEDRYPYKAVKGAYVCVTLTKSGTTYTANGTTGDGGLVTFNFLNLPGSCTYTLRITSVTKLNYRYDNQGSVTSKTIQIN